MYSIDEFTNDFKSLSPEKKYGYVYEIAKGSYGTKRLKRYCPEKFMELEVTVSYEIRMYLKKVLFFLYKHSAL